MDAATWKTVNEVFEKALALPEEERSRWVREASGSSAEIAAEVLRLLDADGQASGFLEGSALAAEVTAEPVPPPFATGTVLKNRYEIRQLLGYGGMGHVFEAYDLDLKVSIAIKVLRDDLASQSTALETLRREVRTARIITHLNVCRTYDLDRAVVADASGEPREVVFLTMELLKGETLAARIRRDGALPAPLVLEIAKQIAEGLETAHGSGVTHRDLKPGNIMLVPGEGSNAVPRAVLMDFGIARRDPLFHGDGTTSLSGVELAGTIAYMAPEQLDPSCKVTPAADQYAFGLVLFEMLTGRQTFPSSHFLAGIAERITGAVPSPRAINSAIPVVWERALQIALQPSPEARFASAADLVRAIESGKATSLRSATGSAVRRKVSGQRFQPAATSLYERATGLRQWWVAGFAVALAAVSLLLANSRFHWWGAKADVEAGSLIYLAPVKNETTEKRLDGITELLRASLSQSTQINLLDESRVGDTLERMAKAANTPMTDPLAREVALRTGAVRVVFGTVSGAKGNYRLDIRLEQPDPASPERSRGVWSQKFEWHAPEQESATIPEAMSTALRNAAGWVRKSAGESRNDIARLDAPPEEATTGSWPSLRAYMDAIEMHGKGDAVGALRQLQVAVTLDPQFALAFGRKADIEYELGKEDDGYQDYQRALDPANDRRLSRRERDRLAGMFAIDTGDFAAAEDSFQDYISFYEKDYEGWAYRCLPLRMLGRTEEAIDSLRRADAIDPNAAFAPEMLARYLIAAGHPDQAASLLPRIEALGGTEFAVALRGQMAFLRGSYSDASAQFALLEASKNRAVRRQGLGLNARLAAETGDLAQALRRIDVMVQMDSQPGAETQLGRDLADKAFVLMQLGRSAEALTMVNAFLAASNESYGKDTALEVAGGILAGRHDAAVDQGIALLLERLQTGLLRARNAPRNKALFLTAQALQMLRTHQLQEAALRAQGAEALLAPAAPRAALGVIRRAAAEALAEEPRRRMLQLAREDYESVARRPEFYWDAPMEFPPGFVRWSRSALAPLQHGSQAAGPNGSNGRS